MVQIAGFPSWRQAFATCGAAFAPEASLVASDCVTLPYDLYLSSSVVTLYPTVKLYATWFGFDVR
jgi:hypothetical protein